uniref:Uncharacterized protein n=1 Tax=Timema tahoe TaxID=61484 RepID=A0A7R9IK31_9NEOP|nr:unnamed protein product [Timema tahoe]
MLDPLANRTNYFFPREKTLREPARCSRGGLWEHWASDDVVVKPSESLEEQSRCKLYISVVNPRDLFYVTPVLSVLRFGGRGATKGDTIYLTQVTMINCKDCHKLPPLPQLKILLGTNGFVGWVKEVGERRGATDPMAAIGAFTLMRTHA